MGTAKLRIDCAGVNPNVIRSLVKFLSGFLKVEVAGGDLIYATGRISPYNYGRVWDALRLFKVKID